MGDTVVVFLKGSVGYHRRPLPYFVVPRDHPEDNQRSYITPQINKAGWFHRGVKISTFLGLVGECSAGIVEGWRVFGEHVWDIWEAQGRFGTLPAAGDSPSNSNPSLGTQPVPLNFFTAASASARIVCSSVRLVTLLSERDLHYAWHHTVFHLHLGLRRHWLGERVGWCCWSHWSESVTFTTSSYCYHHLYVGCLGFG